MRPRFVLVFAFILLPVISLAQGSLRLEQGILIAQTSSLEARFQQGAVVSLLNRLTQEQYIVRPGAKLVAISELEPNASELSAGAWTLDTSDPQRPKASLEYSGSGRRLNYEITLGADDELILRLSASTDKPGMISATWGVSGLAIKPGKLIVPGQTGTYFDEQDEYGLLSLDYPVHWENQMAVYEGKLGSLLIYCGDSKPRFKRLNATTQTAALDVAFETFATGPYSTATEVSTTEWRIAAFQGNWRKPAERYKLRMSQTHPFVQPTGNRAWIKNIRAIVISFISDTSVLDRLAKELIPSKTLIHVVDWRTDAFDINYPEYKPLKAAKTFIDYAHKLGFRVMLHTNLVGISEVNPQYSNYSEFQMRQASDRQLIGWLWNEFPPGHPRRVAYISPASSAFRKLIIERFRPAIEQLKPDAIHLDAGGAIINDGNGLIEGMNSIEGMIEMHKDLIEAFPDVVWGGESTNEVIGQFNWLAQRWASNYMPHPMGNYLMNDQVLFYGFLDQPPADEPGFLAYLRRYEAQGVLPAVVIVTEANLNADRTRTSELLKQLQRWQQKEYTPDWSEDWKDSIFRMKSSDGSSTATVETDGNLVRLVEDGKKIYERVRRANQLQSEYFIPGWPAYDNQKLLGLDPNNEYWLTPEPYRPQSLIHLEKIPENYRIGLGTFVDSKYGYFELEPVQNRWFDYIAELPAARTGVRYDKDYPLLNGALVTITRAVVGGELRNSALVTLPPSRNNLNGATYIEYTINVPRVPKVLLRFEAGIADSAGPSDGMLLGVQVNGATLWRQTVPTRKWEEASIDLTSYGGSSVTVRLLAHAGMNLNTSNDFGCWANIRLDLNFVESNASIQLSSSGGGPPVDFSKNIVVDQISGSGVSARVALPGKFVVFQKEPTAILTGESLLDFPYEVWKSYYGGIPEKASVEGSGSIEAASSDGIFKPITLVAIPPRNGQTIITTAVRVPEDANSLSVEYGLTDPPSELGGVAEYSGLAFRVQINENLLMDEEVRSAGWRSKLLDLTPYRGKNVLIQLKTDALKVSIFDYARWADLKIQ